MIPRSRLGDVRFGSQADFAECETNVCFTPRKRTFVERVGMSALCQKQTRAPQQKKPYSISSSARCRKDSGSRLLDRQVARFSPTQNFVDVVSGAAKQV